jgi:copper chaperone CopZ
MLYCLQRKKHRKQRNSQTQLSLVKKINTMFKKIFIALIILTGLSNKSMAGSLLDTTINVKVKGVTCNNDLTTLSTNVKALKGVTECKPGKAGAVSSFSITYDPSLVSTKEIYAAFENTGGCSNPDSRPYKIKN